MLRQSIQNKLALLEKEDLTRKRRVISNRQGASIVIEGKPCLNFASNDYLGLAVSELVKKSFVEGIEKYGVGSGASALISGYYEPQQKLEEHFAKFLKRERALYFNSGYAANLGIMRALFGKDDLIVSDKLCHASILDGISLSGAKHRRFQHNDIDQLSLILEGNRERSAIITESVFSMRGDIAPLREISNLAKKHEATLIVDDAHGIGVLGERGYGISEEYNEAIDCLITPLGKSLGGMGAIVSGSADLIEAIVQFARTYHFATALPPAMACATSQALKLLQTETWRVQQLRERIQFFIEKSESLGLKLISKQITPIKSFLVASNTQVLQIQNALLDKGFYVGAIRPPTVPVGESCLRVSLSCLHTEGKITSLLECLAEALVP